MVGKWRSDRRTVHISSKWYSCARKNPYALYPVSQTSQQLCLWNSSNVRLTDGGPFSSFHGRSWSVFQTRVNVYILVKKAAMGDIVNKGIMIYGTMSRFHRTSKLQFLPRQLQSVPASYLFPLSVLKRTLIFFLWSTTSRKETKKQKKGREQKREKKEKHRK